MACQDLHFNGFGLFFRSYYTAALRRESADAALVRI
jgi:hypothetical protein